MDKIYLGLKTLQNKLSIIEVGSKNNKDIIRVEPEIEISFGNYTQYHKYDPELDMKYYDLFHINMETILYILNITNDKPIIKYYKTFKDSNKIKYVNIGDEKYSLKKINLGHPLEITKKYPIIPRIKFNIEEYMQWNTSKDIQAIDTIRNYKRESYIGKKWRLDIQIFEDNYPSKCSFELEYLDKGMDTRQIYDIAVLFTQFMSYTNINLPFIYYTLKSRYILHMPLDQIKFLSFQSNPVDIGRNTLYHLREDTYIIINKLSGPSAYICFINGKTYKIVKIADSTSYVDANVTILFGNIYNLLPGQLILGAIDVKTNDFYAYDIWDSNNINYKMRERLSILSGIKIKRVKFSLDGKNKLPSREDIPYDTDGYIFMPAMLPYKNNYIFKWKLYHSIDFKLFPIKDNGVLYGYLYCSADKEYFDNFPKYVSSLVNHEFLKRNIEYIRRDKYILFVDHQKDMASLYRIPIIKRDSDYFIKLFDENGTLAPIDIGTNPIIETTYYNNEWRVLQIRIDKTEPNYYKIASDIFKVLLDPITSDEIMKIFNKK